MAGTKSLGYVLLGGCGASVLAAVVLAVTAATQEWEQARVIAATGALAVVAEVCFWAGGGLVGLSMIRRRREALVRTMDRVAFWR